MEGDCSGRNPEPVDGKLINLGMWFVDADRFDGEHGVEERAQPRFSDRRVEHHGRAVRQDCGAQARRLEPSEDFRDLRKRLERQVKIHQPIAQAGLFDRQRLQGEVECIAGDLPEIRVPALDRPQPGILQLLVAPERGQLFDGVSQDVAAASRR